MYLADMHTHTEYSPDSNEPMGKMAAAAAKYGLDCVCFTDHCDIIGLKDPKFKMDFTGMRAEFEKIKERYNGEMRLLLGIELGEATHAPDIAERILKENRLDFVLASIHNLKNGDDFYYIKYTSKKQCEEYLEEYLDELIILCRWGNFDSLAHFTYPLRYMVGREGLDVDFSAFYDKVKELFKILIDSGKSLELNTSGINRKYGQFMPYPALLKLYRKCGGELLTVGSDAHRAPNIAAGLTEGYELLRQLGFKYATVYENRKPEQIKI